MGKGIVFVAGAVIHHDAGLFPAKTRLAFDRGVCVCGGGVQETMGTTFGMFGLWP